MEKQKKALLFALSAIFMWSTVAVPFKLGLQAFHYIHFLFFTILIAALFSFASLLITGKLKQLKELSKRDWLWGIIGGILNPFLYYLILFKAYSILPAQIAQALNYTWPIMLVILSIPILGQKLSLPAFFSLLLGFFGVYLIASEGQPWPLEPSNPFGVMLALGSSIVWASYWLINAKSKVAPELNLFINFTTGLLLVIPLLFFVPFNYTVSSPDWLFVGYAGLFEMGITFAVWLQAMRLTQRTDSISNYVFLSPFLSLVFIRIFLKEHIYLTTLIGLCLIILSILFKRLYLDKREASK